VNAFARNLQGDGSAVTVDTHATQAALNDVTVTIGLTAARYAVFADAYRAAAMHAGLRPCDFQAVVWHIWKRKYPRGLKNKLRQQWHVVGEL
jgi:hypothetical protein